MTKRQTLGGASALFGAAFIYSTFGILVREMSKMFGDIAQSAARFGLAAIIIVVVCLVLKKKLKLPRREALLAATLGLCFAIVIALYSIAANATTLSNAVAVLYGASIVTSFIIGTVFLKEKVTKTKIIALALAIVGLSLYSGVLGAVTVGLLAAFGSGVFEGLGNPLRKMLSGVDRNVVLTYQFVVGTIVLLLAMVAFGEQPIREISLMPIIATIIFAILQITLGNLLLYGFKHFDVNVGSIILSMELVFATLFGLILFGEVPSAGELIGGSLILLASISATVDVPALFKKLKRA